MDTTKVLLVSISAVVFIVGILVLLYMAYNALSKKMGQENSMKLGRIDTSLYSVIPSAEVIKPYDGYNYSFLISMRINNFYHNYGYWRHILHTGTDIESDSVLEYPYEGEGIDNWDTIIGDFPDQNPGIWLHPTQNTLRLVITTEEFREGHYPEHAHPETVFRAKETTELEETKKIVNTVDIPDIPINTDFKLAFSLYENNVTVFLNGKIRNIFTIRGKPYENIGSMYIHKNKTYSGHINSLEVHPRVLQDKRIKEF